MKNYNLILLLISSGTCLYSQPLVQELNRLEGSLVNLEQTLRNKKTSALTPQQLSKKIQEYKNLYNTKDRFYSSIIKIFNSYMRKSQQCNIRYDFNKTLEPVLNLVDQLGQLTTILKVLDQNKKNIAEQPANEIIKITRDIISLLQKFKSEINNVQFGDAHIINIPDIPRKTKDFVTFNDIKAELQSALDKQIETLEDIINAWRI